jgi:predicted HAD superfamily Cof-like phosphohydrolase
MNIREQVAEFHNAIGANILLRPTKPDDAVLRRRLQLVGEEFCELCEAMGFMRLGFMTRSLLNTPEFNTPTADFNMVKTADACADVDYTVEGTRLELGIYGPPVADEVHRANMRKVGGPRREDGKQMKPDGFVGPDVAGVLRAQGWKP